MDRTAPRPPTARPISEPSEQPPPPDPDARQRALQAAVDARVAEGWRVTAQSTLDAHLARPKPRNKVLFWLVAFGVVRGILQPLLLMAQGEDRLDLTVDQDGHVHERRR